MQVSGEMRAAGTNPIIRAFSSGAGAGQLFMQVVDGSSPVGYVGTNVSGMPLVLVSGGNAEAVRIRSDGNVGIGSSNPTSELIVDDEALGSTRAPFGIDITTNYVKVQSSGQGPSPGFLALNPDGNNVGIGTVSPTAKLHVAGDIKVDGNIAAKYQDVAEWVPSAERIPPRSVVVLSDVRNGVLASTMAYDEAIAGVVSVHPGVVLGESGPGMALIAHSGRVRVKADATYGAIARGDVLVSSPTPGHAMKSEPVDVGTAKLHRPGTILGKAIEPLSSGRGEILVLLTLQ